MEIGIDSFAAILPDPVTGALPSATDRMADLLGEIEVADRVGLDVFGIGEHHRAEFLDSAPISMCTAKGLSPVAETVARVRSAAIAYDLARITAALAECTAMTVRWFARQQGWPLEHVEVTVDHAKKLVAGTSTPVDVFDKVLFIRGRELTDEQRARLIDVASKCPVQRILEGAPAITTRMGVSLDNHFDA